MPYIEKSRRAANDAVLAADPRTAGELNYAITQLVLKYTERQPNSTSHFFPESYQAYNDAIGALEGAKLELYRRRVASYEDTKLSENGDVYYFGGR